MENDKEIDGGDLKETSNASAEEEEKKPAYLPLPEEPKGDRNLLCRVGVRLPDGRRVQRNFLRTDPVQVNFYGPILEILLYDIKFYLIFFPGWCIYIMKQGTCLDVSDQYWSYPIKFILVNDQNVE